MLISTLNCEMWPNFSYRGVRSVQLLLLLLLLMVFSLENFGFSPPYAGIAGIGPVQRRNLVASLIPFAVSGLKRFPCLIDLCKLMNRIRGLKFLCLNFNNLN